MKKLLAAVTSIVMSTSFTASAFASSITVSAAGGVSAVQPNVSLEEAIDGAATKGAANDIMEDFIIEGGKYTAEPGETVMVDFIAHANGHKSATMRAELADLPAGITAEMNDNTNYCFDSQPGWSLQGSTYGCETRNAAEDPLDVAEDVVITFDVTLPADIAPGEYEINLSRFHVVEKAQVPVNEYDCKVIPAVITVKGDIDDQPTEPVTKAPSQSGNVQEDFIIEGGKYTAAPGDVVMVDFIAHANGHKSATMRCELAALPAGITAEMTDNTNYCFDSQPGWSLQGSTYGCETRNASEDPLDVAEDVVITFDVTLPADIAPGEYEINLSRFHVVEKAQVPVNEYDCKVIPAVITVKGDIDDQPTEPVTKAPTTEAPTKAPSQSGNVQEDFIIEGGKYTAAPGDVVMVDFIAHANGHKSATMRCELADLPAGITAEMTDNTNYCFDSQPGWSLQGSTYGCETRNASEDPLDVAEDVVITFDVTLPADIAPGDYEINLSRFHVVEKAQVPVNEYDCLVIPAVITVKGETDTTEPPVAEGSVKWVIDKVHTQAGTTVELPVYVDGASDLAVAGASFGVTANGVTLNGVTNASAAYGNAPITSNLATNEIAFAQAAGQGSAAADKAVIVTLTYDVPAGATGEIPVKWANVVVSDTNGNLITEKVVTVDGAIIIDEPITTEAPTVPPTVAEGSVKWVIEEKHAKAGETVTLNAYVDGASDLAVAGASFGVTADTVTLSGVGNSSAAYGNAFVTSNLNTKEIAFAQANGQGSAAADKAVIVTLTYDVPAGATGRIPVKWANVVVSDTNGNLITEKVVTVDGAIIIDEPITTEPPVAEGSVKWVIDKVHTQAGTTVELKVYVDGASDLAVAGASFGVTANGVTLTGVTNASAAYGNAPITSNLDTTEIAFAQADGKGSAASDQAIILTLTYDVPADATGEIPVKWANVVVSDTNGNLITEKVVTVDGAIIIDGPGTTVAPTTAVPTTAPTTEPPTVPTTAAPTTAASTAAPTTEPPTHAPAAEGTVVWVIDTVYAQPGETVQLPVFVSGDSDLAVAGASFGIVSADGITLTGSNDSCAAYGGAAITGNINTSEFAFAQADGKGSAASDNAVIMYLTYQVPDDASGEYPVSWANVVVSDTNGNIITEKVELVSGAIIITVPTTTEAPEDPTTEPPTVPTTGTPTATTTEVITTTTTNTDGGELPTTTPTTVPTTEPPTEPNTYPVAEGNVAWVLDNVTGVPGETVTLTIKVLDPNGTKLPVGGAYFGLSAEPALVGADGTPYGAELIYNIDTREFAFADAAGNGVPSEDGTIMMQIQYTIPEDAVPGTVYPVDFADLSVSDEYGNEISDKVVYINGTITVIEPPTTAVTTTEPPTVPTTEPPTVPTTVPTTEPPTTVPTTEPPTVPTTTTTEPPVTAPSGAIVWQGQTVTAAPGEEIELSFVVLDPNNTLLEIGGAQFVIDADGNVTLLGADGSAAYKSDLIYNTDTNEYAFGHAEGQGVAAANGSAVVTLKFKVPENAADGDEYPVNLGDLVVSDANGLYITDHVLVIAGKIIVKVPVTTEPPTVPTTEPATVPTTEPATVPTTEPATVPTTEPATVPTTTEPATVPTTESATVPTTTEPATVPTTESATATPTTTTHTGTAAPWTVTTTAKVPPVIPPEYSTTVKAAKGFFFSHDPRPFPAELIDAKEMIVDGAPVPFDASLVSFEDTVNGGNTPETAYRKTQTDFTYKLYAYYNGEPIFFDDGEQVIITVYIGVKGDSDLDNIVNASDATNALAFFAKIQTGGVATETRITPTTNALVNSNPDLDILGAFLVDVDLDCYSRDNWNKGKKRQIDSSDASWVLTFYSKEQTGMAGKAHENWNQTLASTNRGERFDQYKENGVIYD